MAVLILSLGGKLCMEYSINKLAQLAGVSTRTLRYYDEFDLLKPMRVNSNGYRVYGHTEVDLLQQILLYREMDMPLEDIRKIVLSKHFDGKSALEKHLGVLRKKKNRLELIIANVEKTILAMKGETTMTDEEKFIGLKQQMLNANEERYGQEIRDKYGVETVEASNKKFLGMTQEQKLELEQVSAEFNEALKKAFAKGDASSDLAKRACELHKKWLMFYWDNYSKEAHIGVTNMYVTDPRFTAYYDQIAVGSAIFLRDAVEEYCK
jgi:DNA-binding transcriptional MerR regulator